MSPRDQASAWPLGESEMARLIRQHDWAATALGSIEAWPQSLRTLVDLMLGSRTMMCLMWGSSASLIYNDPYAHRIAGDHPEALGRSSFEVWPAMRGVFEPHLVRAWAGEEAIVRDQHLVRARPGAPPGAPSEESWFDLTYTPVRDESGRVAGTLVGLVDTTERVLADRALRESEARLAAVFEVLPVGVGVTDAEGNLLLSNPEMRRYWPTGKLPSRDPERSGRWRAYHPDGRPVEPKDFPGARALQGERVVPGLEVLYLGEDREVWTSVTAAPIRDEQGRVTGEVAVVSDIDALKRTADALRSSEERLQLATDAAALGIFDVDLVTLRMDWDARQRRLWGVGQDEVITDETFISGIHPDDRDLVRAAVARAFDPQGDHLYAAEYRLRDRGDGIERWVAATGRVHFAGQRPVRLIGTVQDISTQKRTEAALRELNETLEQRVSEALAERRLLAQVFETTDAMISVADPDLRLLAFNRPYAQEVERLGGRRPRVGDRIPDLYAGHPELAAPVEANWGRALAGEVFSMTEEHGDPRRYRRSYERRFEPLRDGEGRVIGAYQYATDVTERLRDRRRAEEAEAAQREADALYRAYFQNSGEALFVVGVLPDGGFTFEEVNPAHRAALGSDIAAAPGRRIEEVLPPEVAEEVAANYRRVVATGELQRYRESAELGGRVIHAETVLVPVRDETGRITRIVGSGRDMTAQVQAEEALRQSQKMEAMGQLTGGVAHDFNNLLTPILGGLDRLQRRKLGTERDQRLIEGALQSAERARTLVQRLLAFARRQPLQPMSVNLADLVQGMADLVRSTTGPQIRVAVEVEPDLPAALADANQLEMAILNLAVNARDAMPEGGTLRISATSETAGLEQRGAAVAPGRYLRLSVADTGVGMDEATLARAVEPFFSTKGIGRGTGLGLSMVHGLAAQLGGALTIRSRPGLGTNVELWLPVAADEAAGGVRLPRDADEEALDRAQGTVLLVDDEALVRATAADMLSELGYAVVEAGSADEAMKLVDEGLAPDILVTDHLMPGRTGTELARILQERLAGLPVLIVSGYADVEGIAPELPRLAKPFRRGELAASLQALRT